GMLMGLRFLIGYPFKLRIEPVQLSLGSLKIETLEMVGLRPATGLRKPYSFPLARDRHYMSFALVGKEIIQAYAEHHRNSEQCGKSGKKLFALKLRQHRRR